MELFMNFKSIGLLLGFGVLALLFSLGGCRTLYPPNQNSQQPWAQPEPWQGAPGIPGLNSSVSGSEY